jgi:serine/threonine protein kinase
MTVTHIPIISSTFTNRDGKHFDKVREIAFKKGELMGNLGKFVAETKHERNPFFKCSGNLNNGVYIYQDYNNPLIAYRIYKSFADYRFNGFMDDELIQKLMERKDKITFSKLPTGVVTLDGLIIGQEIPYFPFSVTLHDYFLKFNNIEILKIYKRVLEQLKELYNNGIIYTDIHPNNFMINLNDGNIDVIDFDYFLIKIDSASLTDLKKMLLNFNRMINYLNNICGVDLTISQFKLTENFEDTFYELDKMSKRLVNIHKL